MPRRTPRALFLLAGFTGLFLPSAAGVAQTLEATAFAGGALLVSDLSDEFSVQTGAGVQTAVQSHDNGLALGVHVGALWAPVSVEGTLAYVPTNLVTEFQGSQAPEAITEDQSILMLGASVLYNFPGRFFEPFLAAGAGVKSYSADDPGGGFEAGSDVAFNLGGGGRIFISETLAIRVDLRDWISTFDAFEDIPDVDQDAQIQHDILLTIGLTYRGR